MTRTHRTPLAVALVTALVAPARADDAPLLPHGPHAVGFRATILLDHGRAYRTTWDDGATYGGDGKAPRPVLLRMWYPATDVAPTTDEATAPRSMTHGRAFELARLADGAGGDAAALARWADALSAYAADVACTEALGVPVADLDETTAPLWDAFLARPTRCVEDAPPLPGPFPWVVHHSGAGSSYEDDDAFLAALASHGYVVLGSAYPAADGGGFGIDSKDGSVRDMELLARHAATLPSVDWTRGAFGGHSAGAQVCLRARLRPDCPADALYLLDTTLDYYTPAVPTFRYLTDPVLADPGAFTVPMLVTAGHEAMFRVCDALDRAERTYVTFPELGHNEYIAQGVLRLDALSALHALRPDAATTSAVARRDEVRRLYRSLCESVRQFLDAELRDDRAGFDAFVEAASARPLGGPDACAQVAPPGDRGVPAWSADAGRAPSPRELTPLLATGGADALLAALDAHVDDEPRAPVYGSTMIAGSLVYDLAVEDRLDDARALHAWYARHDVDALSALRFLAFMSRLTGADGRARHYLRVALDVAPDDPATLEKLAELDGDG